MPGERICGQDPTFKNGESSSDITSKLGVIYDTSSDYTVKIGTTNSKYFAGISMEKFSAGKNGAVRQEGDAIATAAETINRGDRVYLKGSAGKFASVEENSTGTEQTFYVCGIAKTAASTDGDEFLIAIQHPAVYWRA